MERARGSQAEADAPEEEEEEKVGAAMAAAVAATGGAGPAVLQVAGLYRGLCAVRSRALGLGLVSPAQLRVFPVRRGSGRPAGGADGSGVEAELEANPFYDRYRDKIQQLRRCGPATGGEEGGAWPALLMCLYPASSVPLAALPGDHWYCSHSADGCLGSERLRHLPKITQLV